jgi:hypothetical protein
LCRIRPLPGRLFVESQERHMRALLESAAQQHEAAAEAARRRHSATSESGVGLRQPWHLIKVSGD